MDYEKLEKVRVMLRRFDGEVKVVLIKTKANRVAHTLANNARISYYGGPSYQEFINPPPNCLLFLERDETGCVSNFYLLFYQNNKPKFVTHVCFSFFFISVEMFRNYPNLIYESLCLVVYEIEFDTNLLSG